MKRWRHVLVLFTLLALATIDVVDDLREGVDVGHAWIEIAMIAIATLGLTIEVRRLRSRAAALEIESRALSGRLDLAQAETAAWKAEARALSSGVSDAIDRQLVRWQLTEAEKETALLLLKGLSHKEIADVRNVGEASARQQARAIYKKAGLSGRADLAAFFLEDLLVVEAKSA